MIQSLSIHNFGFFTQLELDFQAGFTAITGETGAGKTTFLEAIKAVLGHKIAKTLCAESGATVLELVLKNPLTGGDSEGFIDENETEIFIRLVVKNQGRPRYFINENPINQAELKTFTDSWFVLHAQHEISSLKKNTVTREWLDTYAHVQTDLADYQTAWKTYNDLQKKLAQLQTDDRENDIEYWQYLAQELAEENLDPDFVLSLEERVRRADNQEKIVESLQSAIETLEGKQGMLGQISTLQIALDKLQKYGLDLTDIPLEIEVLSEQLNDLAAFIQDQASEQSMTEEDPQELQGAYQRLVRLQEKHNVHSFTELAETEITIQQKIGDIELRTTKIAALQSQIIEQEQWLWTTAKNLHEQRVSAGKKLAQALATTVQPLGILKARFEIEVTERKILNLYGCSDVEWRFSANPGKSPEKLSISASGGELSRVMLGLYQLLNQKNAANVLFFDEIDTGISGAVLQQMAEQLQLLGQNQQIIAITHQGIMASQADQHWHIRKKQFTDRTESLIEILDQSSRASVIAELMSGNKETKQAQDLARNMLGKH